MAKPPKVQPWMIFASVTLLALGLNRMLPWPLPDFAYARPLGWGVFALGLVFLFGGMGYLSKAFKARGVWDPDQLITGGFLKFSRNPFYLGVGLTIAGVGLQRGLPWLISGALVMLLLLNFLVIPFEETMLEEKFGKAYLAYRKRVRRWL